MNQLIYDSYSKYNSDDDELWAGFVQLLFNCCNSIAYFE